ncbi:hypothetical protein SASPL_149087 [Salvia splendens]|uniref:peroxidase n=1 Tax=Salvia splendens TaxID=180675 RepID=A0A8X8Z4Q3_SALSN|nr:hypothetical protein SASPL_149087 [Salvia splendens]
MLLKNGLLRQLSEGAKIPSSACVRTYEIKDSQGVIWIWMSRKSPPNPAKIPWFENFERPGFRDLSTIHELPYDHSILFREPHGSFPCSYLTQQLRFYCEKGRSRTVSNRQVIDKKGQKIHFTGLFLCRPSGQGKSMLIVRFGNTMKPSFVFKLLRKWFSHQTASKILEEDMGFLSSQNEILVAEYRRWMDKVGHGMPYHFGHSTVSLPGNPALVEHAPAGFTASLSASQPAKGGIGSMHAPKPANRYFRHVIQCKECRNVVKLCRAWKKALSVAAAVSTALAILASGRMSRVLLLLSAAVFVAGIQICSSVIAMNTINYIRSHRRLLQKAQQDMDYVYKLLMLMSSITLCLLPFSSCSAPSVGFYAGSCPAAELMVKNTVRSASDLDPMIPGKLLRLLFHDCFIEASYTYFTLSYLRLQDSNVIDSAKRLLEIFCPGTVSCADILALAARDAVEYTGGPSVQIPTGRRDGRISAAANVRPNIIDTSFTLDEMAKLFSIKGLSMDDLVTLSGGHTIGKSHCSSFNDRFKVDPSGNVTVIDSSLDRQYAVQLAKMCPGGAKDDSITVNNDPGTPFQFDNQYYRIVLEHKGLFQSDSALVNDNRTRSKVVEFANSQDGFYENWAVSFLKLTMIGVKIGDEGEIRQTCSMPN